MISLFRGADRFEILRLREHSIRKKIRALIETKQKAVSQRQLRTDPVTKTCIIGIIGYTNSGKTTLIKRFLSTKIFIGRINYFLIC